MKWKDAISDSRKNLSSSLREARRKLVVEGISGGVLPEDARLHAHANDFSVVWASSQYPALAGQSRLSTPSNKIVAELFSPFDGARGTPEADAVLHAAEEAARDNLDSLRAKAKAAIAVGAKLVKVGEKDAKKRDEEAAAEKLLARRQKEEIEEAAEGEDPDRTEDRVSLSRLSLKNLQDAAAEAGIASKGLLKPALIEALLDAADEAEEAAEEDGGEDEEDAEEETEAEEADEGEAEAPPPKRRASQAGTKVPAVAPAGKRQTAAQKKQEAAELAKIEALSAKARKAALTEDAEDDEDAPLPPMSSAGKKDRLGGLEKHLATKRVTKKDRPDYEPPPIGKLRDKTTPEGYGNDILLYLLKDGSTQVWIKGSLTVSFARAVGQGRNSWMVAKAYANNWIDRKNAQGVRKKSRLNVRVVFSTEEEPGTVNVLVESIASKVGVGRKVPGHEVVLKQLMSEKSRANPRSNRPFRSAHSRQVSAELSESFRRNGYAVPVLAALGGFAAGAYARPMLDAPLRARGKVPEHDPDFRALLERRLVELTPLRGSDVVAEERHIRRALAMRANPRYGQYADGESRRLRDAELLRKALAEDARERVKWAGDPLHKWSKALFSVNPDYSLEREVKWTADMVGGTQEDPEIEYRPHPVWVSNATKVGETFDISRSFGSSYRDRYKVTAPGEAVKIATVRRKYSWDETGEHGDTVTSVLPSAMARRP